MVETTGRPAPLADAIGDDTERRAPIVTMFSGDRAERLERLADAPRDPRDSTLLWIDAPSTTDAIATCIADHLGLDREAVDSLVHHGDRAAFREGGTYVHITVQAPDERHERLRPVVCLIGKNWIVTAHDRPVAVLEGFTELAASGSARTGELRASAFLAALLEWVMNEYVMAFERVEQELDDIDDQSLRGDNDPEEAIARMVELRRRTALLRRALNAHRVPLLALTQPELEALGDAEGANRFQGVYARYEGTLQTARDARDGIVSSFDVLIARTGHRTNEIVKVLTLASVIFLPGALIAGLMGMNFKIGLFAHPIGFWIVVGSVTAIAVVTLVVAKLRSWI
jgi:magnesium transporter